MISITVLKEFAIGVAVAAAAQVVLGLAVFQTNPDQVLANPKEWAIAFAASVGRTALIAAALKARELFQRFVAAQGE